MRRTRDQGSTSAGGPYLACRMREAVDLGTRHAADGGVPFAALIVDGAGNVLGHGVNRVRDHHDPTAHAEVEAIRDACRNVAAPHLAGATLLASGEPCALCYLASFYAGISRVFYAVDRDAAAAHGFDYRGTYAMFAQDPRTWPSPIAGPLEIADGTRPFQTFLTVKGGQDRRRS